MESIIVEVQEDHLKTLTSASPIKALEELVYNALDADATFVEIIVEHNTIYGIGKIIVRDNGVGIDEDNKKFFKGLGGSWKRNTRRTELFNRIIHGQYGKGRFKAFALGEIVTWKTCYKNDRKCLAWEIIGDSSKDIRRFQVSKPEETDSDHGTTVIIENINEKARHINKKSAIESLTSELALYLTNYNNVQVMYDGEYIDPQKHIVGRKEYIIPVNAEDEEFTCNIIVLEWSIGTEKAMYFCDSSGFVLERREMRISTSGFIISVYIKSEYLAESYANGNLVMGELDPKLKKIIEAGKSCARAYCREKQVQEGQGIIEAWKREDIYPYTEPAINEVQQVERQVFDVVALNINEHLPEFEGSDRTSKKLSLTLVREALENNPRELGKILERVINLPKDRIEDLNQLLKYTTLSDIIIASKTVSDRLNFLSGLEALIYKYKDYTKERSQLHKILENNTWIFGEEFNMALSDKSLNSVLESHLGILRSAKRGKKEIPVLREGKRRGIIDIMLSRRIPESNPQEHTHLIIELKRPSQIINQNVMAQVVSYANAVMKDDRFKHVKARWYFWAVSNTISEEVELMVKPNNQPEGLYKDGENFQIWAMPWSKIFDNCKGRLHFFQNELKFESSAEHSIEYLRKIYTNYMPNELS